MRVIALRMIYLRNQFRAKKKSLRWIKLSSKDCWAPGTTNLVKMLYKVQNPRISLKQSRIVKEVNQPESLISAFKIVAGLIGKLNSLLRKSRSTTATILRKIQAVAPPAMRDRLSSPIKIDQKALKKKTGRKINRCSRNAAKTRTN